MGSPALKISALVFGKNAEATVLKAIQSVDFADEVIYIDAGSSDRTKEIARSRKVKVVDFPGGSEYVEPVRNFGLEEAQHEWILVLDADEEVPLTLATKLQSLTTKTEAVWEVPRKNLIFGHWVQHTGWWPDYQVRFFRKGSVSWSNKIHSPAKTHEPKSQLNPEEDLALVHHNIASVSQYVQRMDHYTNLEVNSGPSSGDVSGNEALRAFFSDFYRRLFKEEGYKDQNLGIYLSLLQSFYQSVTVLKKWEQKGYPQNSQLDISLIEQLESDFRYWIYSYHVDNAPTPIQKWYWQVRRRLRL